MNVDGQTYFLSGFWELLLVFLLSSWHIYVSANWQTLSLFRLPPPRSCFLVTTALCSYPLQFLKFKFKSCLIQNLITLLILIQKLFNSLIVMDSCIVHCVNETGSGTFSAPNFFSDRFQDFFRDQISFDPGSKTFSVNKLPKYIFKWYVFPNPGLR